MISKYETWNNWIKYIQIWKIEVEKNTDLRPQHYLVTTQFYAKSWWKKHIYVYKNIEKSGPKNVNFGAQKSKNKESKNRNQPSNNPESKCNSWIQARNSKRHIIQKSTNTYQRIELTKSRNPKIKSRKSKTKQKNNRNTH